MNNIFFLQILGFLSEPENSGNFLTYQPWSEKEIFTCNCWEINFFILNNFLRLLYFGVFRPGTRILGSGLISNWAAFWFKKNSGRKLPWPCIRESYFRKRLKFIFFHDLKITLKPSFESNRWRLWMLSCLCRRWNAFGRK